MTSSSHLIKQLSECEDSFLKTLLNQTFTVKVQTLQIEQTDVTLDFLGSGMCSEKIK